MKAARPTSRQGEVLRAIVSNALRCVRSGSRRRAVARKFIDIAAGDETPGHDGSMTTIHANSARDGVSRLENMICDGGIEIAWKAVRSQDFTAVN